MKTFSVILTIFLSFVWHVVFAQSGMTVFGNCSIAENTAVGFFDNSLTLKGDISGEGKLIMAGNAIQTIASDDKKVNHLVIHNPTAVKVQGKLTVAKTLRIEKGDLEVLPQSQLFLEGATVSIAKGSHLIHADAAMQADRGAWLITQQHVATGNYLLAKVSERTNWKRLAWKHLTIYERSLRYQQPYIQIIAPPPQRKTIYFELSV